MLKITKLETFTNEFVGFVRATAENGAQGCGQVSTYNADITCEVFHRQVARHALGTNALDFADTLNLISEREHKYPGSYLRRAMTGLDTALLDLRGKLEGKPVCALLGGTPGKIRAYASSMKRDITPEEEAKRFLKLRDAFGFTAFKWRVGAECGRDRDEWPGRTGVGPGDRQAGGWQFLLLAQTCHRGGTDARRQWHWPF
jgi:L-alanine-DL-glutamate epimerase-like enolase superfamily enzyme